MFEWLEVAGLQVSGAEKVDCFVLAFPVLSELARFVVEQVAVVGVP
jgi:hypothetical protein